MKPLEPLAQLVAEQPWAALPEAVQAHARLVLLDTLGVILLGSTAPEVRALTARLAGRVRAAPQSPRRRPGAGVEGGGWATPGSSLGHGATVLARGFPTTDPRTAALLNGIAGRTPELCEGHRFVSCQAAVQLLPTALAIGEQRGASGPELLAALVLGYQTAVRIGSAVTPHRLAHQNGQWPLLGAIAAGARLYRFDRQDTYRALQAGAALLLAPSYHHVGAGATVLNVAGGLAGFAGALVPELVLAGFEPGEQAVEEAFAELVGRGFSLARLGEYSEWEITRNHFRLRACCSPIYPALDALEACLAELRPSPDQIERIEVATYAFASVMREPRPRNAFAARYSLPHAAAVIVVRGSAEHASFGEDALRDPVVAAVRERVHISEDPELTRQAPRLKPARVTLGLKDGRTTTHFCQASRGGFDDPYPEAELRRKFRALAGEVLSPAGVAEVERLVDGSADVRALIAALRLG